MPRRRISKVFEAKKVAPPKKQVVRRQVSKSRMERRSNSLLQLGEKPDARRNSYCVMVEQNLRKGKLKKG